MNIGSATGPRVLTTCQSCQTDHDFLELCFQNYVFDSRSGEPIGNVATEGEYHFNLGGGGFSVFYCPYCGKGMFLLETSAIGDDDYVEMEINKGPMAGQTMRIPDLERLRNERDAQGFQGHVINTINTINTNDIQEALANSERIEPEPR